MNKNNIFIKNNLNNDGESPVSSDLSDELNSILDSNYTSNKKKSETIETNKIIKSTKLNKPDKPDKPEDFFDITNIFNDISIVLSSNNNIKIMGEIISFKITLSNAWINIKTEEYQFLTIFWKITFDKNYDILKLSKPGDKFIFEGKFAIMKKNLQIYFNIKSMVKFGKGDYLDIYEQYRIKIQEMGLRKHKKILNVFPYNIGIITALGGAVIQDILQTLKLDKFVGKIIIKNSLVQGPQCAKSLINSIEWFESNYTPEQINILMITRGGGGWEDLVGFSNWDLLIKLSSCNFLTLSAVGHQTDNQLTDEICDYRFATPSIGAKFIVENQQKYKLYLVRYKNILEQIVDKYVNFKNKFDSSIVSNYENIIKKYNIKDITIRIKKYSNQIKYILSKYNNLKNIFYSKLSNLKPTIIRKKELTSIEDFVNSQTNTDIKPKKIEIYFIDGMVGLSYKITKYEKYK
jgi:exodeoxyribonuclease VII large subunit